MAWGKILSTAKRQTCWLLVILKKKRLLAVLERGKFVAEFGLWIGLDRIGFYSIPNTETFS